MHSVLGRLFFVSQISQSACSFLIVLAAAHALPPHEFGTFSLCWIVVTLAGSFMRSLSYEQLLAQPNEQGGTTWAVASASGAILVGSSVILGVISNDDTTAWIVAAALFWCTDGFRYAVIPKSAHRWKYLVAIDVGRASLSLASCILAVASFGNWAAILACVAGALWPLASLNSRPRYVAKCLRDYASRLDRFEGFLSLQFLLASGVVQLLPIYALLWLSSAEVGYYRLAQSLVAPIAVLASALQPSLIMKLASRASFTDKWHCVKWSLGALVCVAIVSLSAVALLNGAVIDLLVPQSSRDGVSQVMIFAAASAMLILITLPGVALIKTERKGRLSFVAQLLGAATATSAVTLLLQLGVGLRGLAIGILVGGIVSVTASYALLSRSGSRSALESV